MNYYKIHDIFLITEIFFKILKLHVNRAKSRDLIFFYNFKIVVQCVELKQTKRQC